MAKEKEEKKSPSSSSAEEKESSSGGKSSGGSESSASSSGDKEKKKSSSSEGKSSSSEDKKKSGSSSSEDKKGLSSSSSSSSSEEPDKLVTIDVDKYKPRAPSTPVPAGAEDCFGKYRDPDTIECQKCLEAENCGAVMNSKLKEEGGKMSKKDKEKKAKKSSSSSSEDKKKASSSSASASDDKKDKKKKSSSDEPKSPISELVTGIIAESKAEKKGFKVKMGRSRVVILSGKSRVLKITKANTDKPVVQLKTRYEPEAFGLKDKYWKNKKFTGNLSKLGGYLETYFSNFEKAGKEKKDKKKSSSD